MIASSHCAITQLQKTKQKYYGRSGVHSLEASITSLAGFYDRLFPVDKSLMTKK